MDYPKISIITPSYNQGQYLEETLLSVLDQNYPNLEYIVFDGGSTDNSVEVLKKYEGKLTYWKSEKDKGQSDAINKGLRAATGEIVGWLNSDDLLEPGALFRLAEEFRDASTQMIFSPIRMIDSNSRHGHVSDRKIMDFSSMLFGKQVVNQEGIFWRRRIHERVGYIDISLNYAMDYDFFLRCCMQFRPRYVPHIFACHRKHAAQKTNTTDAYHAEMKKLREQYRESLGFGSLYFSWRSFFQSKRRIISIFGIGNFFKKEWMDR